MTFSEFGVFVCEEFFHETVRWKKAGEIERLEPMSEATSVTSGLEDKRKEFIENYLREAGVDNYFRLSEGSKRALAIGLRDLRIRHIAGVDVATFGKTTTTSSAGLCWPVA